MGIGKTLSTILKEKNSNANELAEKTNIPPTTIYSIIKRDNTKVDIEVLLKICNALDVDMERFYEEYYTNDTTIKKENVSDEYSNEEKRLINIYRKLTSYQQGQILGRAEMFAEQNQSDDTTNKTYTARVAAFGGGNTETEITIDEMRQAEELIRKMKSKQNK